MNEDADNKTNQEDHTPSTDPEVPERAKTRRFTAAYKLKILDEYGGLSKTEKGALLRREGLYSSLVSTWRRERDKGALEALGKKNGRPGKDPRDREIARLRKERDRAFAQLEKARKVVDIQGKLYALLDGLGATSAETKTEPRR